MSDHNNQQRAKKESESQILLTPRERRIYEFLKEMADEDDNIKLHPVIARGVALVTD